MVKHYVGEKYILCIKADGKGRLFKFIEAYNSNRDIRTWGNEMVSIVLLDNKILLESICNLTALNQLVFKFGKNRQNIDKFMETFELIA